MSFRRARNQKGFTLLELLVVVVIVGVLAAAAVPIYLNYVKDSRRAEAKGALGAIVTGESAYYQKNNTYANAADTATIRTLLNTDLSDPSARWTFAITSATTTGFTATATGRAATEAAGLSVQLAYTKGGTPVYTET